MFVQKNTGSCGFFTTIALRVLVSVLFMAFALSTTYTEEGGHIFIANAHIYDASDFLHEEPVAKLSTQVCLISKHSGQQVRWVEKHIFIIPDAHTMLFTPPPEAELSFLS